MINQKNKLRVAIVGGGLNSAVGYAHYCALNLSNQFKIVAGTFSRNSEVNKKTSETYGVLEQHLYSDYKTMLNSEKNNIDVVVILTPNNQHYEQVIYAMELGIPVVCEKALTTNHSEMQRIIELQNDKFLSVVFNYVCYPMVKELRQIVANGDLGKITQVQIEMQQEGFLRLRDGKPMKPQDWRLVDGVVPTISLDLGSHTYSIVKFLTNETPIETIATENSFGNFSNIIDDINSIIKYSNNIVCNMWYSKTALGSRNGLKVRIYGTKGSAEWLQSDPEYLKMADNTGKIFTIDRSSESVYIASDIKLNRFKVGHPAGYIEALANYYEDAASDINNFKIGSNDRNTFGIVESEECILLLEAISKSAKEKNWIKL
jgi:predicted dehydrogenase